MGASSGALRSQKESKSGTQAFFLTSVIFMFRLEGSQTEEDAKLAPPYRLQPRRPQDRDHDHDDHDDDDDDDEEEEEEEQFLAYIIGCTATRPARPCRSLF